MMTRAASPQDRRPLLAITRAAFPEEDLRPLVEALLGRDDVTALVAGLPGDPAGYVLFTHGRISGGSAASARPAALLGPLAVAPHSQGQGIGSALVREGLRRLSSTGKPAVLVLGDPDYYGRFGFFPVPGVTPPYDLPQDWAAAWQGLALDGGSVPEGALHLPDPWNEPSYWSQ